MLKNIWYSAIGLLLIGNIKAQTATDLYQEGLQQVKEKKYDAAASSFKKAIGKRPDYKEAYYETGWCYNELRKYEEAIFYLQKAKQKWSDEPKVFHESGYANLQLNNTAEAIKDFTKCLTLNPDYNIAYKELGNTYFKEKEYKKALENYKLYTIHETGVINETVYFNKGYCENDQGKYSEAIESLKKSIQINAENAGSYNELGYAYAKSGNADEALKNYNDALRINPKYSLAYIGIGDVYKENKKNSDEAIRSYLKAFDLNENSKKVNYCLGWCYNDKTRYNDAVVYLKKAIEIDKGYVDAITELGYSYYALHNYDDALKEFSRSNSITKTELCLYYSGLCYVGKSQKTNALKMYGDLKDMKSSYADKLKNKIDEL